MWNNSCGVSVLALLAHCKAAPLPVFFMSCPSLSTPVQRKLLHTVWIILHDGEQNTGAQRTLSLIGWWEAGLRVCAHTHGDVLHKSQGFPYSREKSKQKVQTSHAALFLFQNTFPHLPPPVPLCEKLRLWGTHMFSAFACTCVQYMWCKFLKDICWLFSLALAHSRLLSVKSLSHSKLNVNRRHSVPNVRKTEFVFYLEHCKSSANIDFDLQFHFCFQTPEGRWTAIFHMKETRNYIKSYSKGL